MYLFVLRYDIEDFKESARETIARSSAIVAVNSALESPEWKGFSAEALRGIPVFAADEKQGIPQELVDFIRSRISFVPH
jgi:hypothetical protein